MFWRERERAKLSIETLLLVFAAQSLTSEKEGVYFFFFLGGGGRGKVGC